MSGCVGVFIAVHNAASGRYVDIDFILQDEAPYKFRLFLFEDPALKGQPRRVEPRS